MLFVHAPLVMDRVLARGVRSRGAMSNDQDLISLFLMFVEGLIRISAQASVMVVVPGRATPDVLERRRREAHAHVYVFASGSHPAQDPTYLLPGTPFAKALLVELNAKGWKVSSVNGSCVATTAHLIRERSGDPSSFHVYSDARDADALTATAGMGGLLQVASLGGEVSSQGGDLRVFCPSVLACDPGWDMRNSIDLIILDILTQGGRGGARNGGLVQDLPGLPRMPGSFAACAMVVGYWAWRREGDGTRRLCEIDADTGAGRVDWDSLAGVLGAYVDAEGGEDDDRTALPEWSGTGWRARHRTAHFPHGFDLACAQYLDALDRELMHLYGQQPRDSGACWDLDPLWHGVYVHGHAPTAADLLGHLAGVGVSRAHTCKRPGAPVLPSHVPVQPVHTWSAQMQLAAVRPRSQPDGRHAPSPLHANLDLGCVFMFPLSYAVWWDTYPVIPALNFRIFEAGFHEQQLDAGPV